MGKDNGGRDLCMQRYRKGVKKLCLFKGATCASMQPKPHMMQAETFKG